MQFDKDKEIEVQRWPDSVRVKMNESSEFYSTPNVYCYGFYDGYQKRNEAINEAIALIQKARNEKEHFDATLQDAIIKLL